MLCTTRGIVIHTLRYSESSLIVRLYTEQLGMISIIVKGVRSRSSKKGTALFQPMTLLDLVVSFHENKNLHHAREYNLAHNFRNIPFDFRKEAILIFINELIYRTIKEEEPNPSLFLYLWNSIQLLDIITDPFFTFHLVFMTNLMQFLGIKPIASTSSTHLCFDLNEGQFRETAGQSGDSLDSFISAEFNRLLSIQLEQCHHFLPPHETRNRLLEILIRYFSMHLPGFHGLKSHRILHAVLS